MGERSARLGREEEERHGRAGPGRAEAGPGDGEKARELDRGVRGEREEGRHRKDGEAGVLRPGDEREGEEDAQPGEEDAVRGAPAQRGQDDPGVAEERRGRGELHQEEEREVEPGRVVALAGRHVPVEPAHEDDALGDPPVASQRLAGEVAPHVVPGAGQEHHPVEGDEDQRGEAAQREPAAKWDAPGAHRAEPQVGEDRERGVEDEVLGGEGGTQRHRAPPLPAGAVGRAPSVSTGPGLGDVLGGRARLCQAPGAEGEEEGEEGVLLGDAVIAHGGGGEREERRGEETRRAPEEPAPEERQGHRGERARHRAGEPGERLHGQPFAQRGHREGDERLHEHGVLDVVAGEVAFQVSQRRQPLVHLVVGEAGGGEVVQAEPEPGRHAEGQGGEPERTEGEGAAAEPGGLGRARAPSRRRGLAHAAW